MADVVVLYGQERSLGEALVEHERWRWMPGMLAHALGDDGSPLPEPRRLVWLPHGDWGHWLACDGDAYYQRTMSEHVPVLDDPGTVGCLWRMLCDDLEADSQDWRAVLRGRCDVHLFSKSGLAFDGTIVDALLMTWDGVLS